MARLRRLPAALALAALWPWFALVEASAADYYVRDLPGLPDGVPPVKMHAGHIEVYPEHNGNLFFWHFQNKHISNRQRTVIWLNGGPGCSSEDGALMEIGPYRLQDKDTLIPNNGSWHEFASLLFVDNPVGTGFSYVDTDSFIHELDTMADHFISFLGKWFDLFPEYEDDDIYIAGESYAGQHIPYIADAILKRNKQSAVRTWNLRGLLIGNGWISPKDQYDSYIPFALDKGLIKQGSDLETQLNELASSCHDDQSNSPGRVDYGKCEDILSKMLQWTKKGSGSDACINMYDVRLKDEYPKCGMNWPPDLPAVTDYLRNDKVTKALHVNEQRNTGWRECDSSVGLAFNTQKSKPSLDLLPGILEQIPLLLFSGAEDLICNHIGTETLINNLEWNGAKGFEVTPGNWAPRRNWTFEGEDAGFWQEARNLTYVLFKDSSHMVPFDFPRRSRDMLDRFMGVDISNIGGEATDSRLDGEKGPSTTVGDVKEESGSSKSHEEIDKAKWAAYRRSGGVVLVIVIIAVVAWGYFVWRERRKHSFYRALNPAESSVVVGRLSSKHGNGDLEASAFDESELDDLHADTSTSQGEHFSPGGGSDSDEAREKGKGKGVVR